MDKRRKPRRAPLDLSDPDVRDWMREREMAFLMGIGEIGWDNHGSDTHYGQPMSRTKRPKYSPAE